MRGKKLNSYRVLIQLLAVLILIAVSYIFLETAFAFFIAVVLVAFIIWRNKFHKPKKK